MRARSTLLPASLLPLLTLACGEVLVDPHGGSGGATASSTSTTGTTAATTSTGTEGSGGGTACGETHDVVSILLTTYDGKSYGCMGIANGSVEMNATVVDAGTDFLAFDSCAPNADCLPMISKLALSAPGIDLGATPKGAFVRVEVGSGLFMGGCGQSIQITNLPSWAGAPNPVDPQERLWLLAVDGGFGASKDFPVAVETIALGCYPNDPQGCGDHDDYLFHFWAALDPNDPGVTVAMGQTKSWFLQSGAFSQQLLVRNLRSFAVGDCDGPHEYAYWMTHTYGLD